MGTALLLILLIVIVIIVIIKTRPDLIERIANQVIEKPPYVYDEPAKQVHDKMFIVDMHADSLLWARSLLEEKDYGHLDLPRLIQANVGLQVFGGVTHFPYGSDPAHHSESEPDLTKLLAWIQGWPRRTWSSKLERALYQADKLQGFVDNSGDKLRLIKTKTDLATLLLDRQTDNEITGAMLLIEGVHALEQDIANLGKLFDAGYRIIGLTHFIDNKAGGSSSGDEQEGLTPWGKALMEKVQDNGMLIDLAHASEQVIDDVLALTTEPVIISHSGVRGTCDHERNVEDRHIQGIADVGGLVGMFYYTEMICGETMDGAARGIEYIVDKFGVETAALGSDFDGYIKTPTDVTGLPLLTEALLARGVSQRDLQKIYGENFLRVLQAVLP